MIDVIHRTQFNPAKLHGHLKMELFDAKTQKLIKTVEKDNMVTNALQYMLNNVAGGTPGNLNGLMMPVATRALGGLMLFSDSLDEHPSNIHFPFGQNQNGDYSYFVAGAGRGVNTSNPMAGSLNAAESGPTNRGYVSVWDFGTSQANGRIKAAALTQCSAERGTTPFRSGISSYSCHTIRRGDGYTSWGAQPLYYDTETGLMYFTSRESSMGYSKTSVYDSQTRTYTYTYTMSIYSTYLPLQAYKVGDAVDAYTLPVFVKSISWQSHNNYDPEFLPGYDGNAYMAYTPGNAEGDGVVEYLTLQTDDLSFQLLSVETLEIYEAYLRQGQNIRICGEDFWALSYDRRGIYWFNPIDTEALYFQFPDNCWANDPGRMCPDGGINLMLYCPAANEQAGYYDQYDAMIYPDGTIIKDGSYFTRNQSTYTGGSMGYTQCAYESPYLWVWGGRSGLSSTAYGCIGVASPRYLGTIANLGTTIDKNATQTLKVTYTLTDES